MSDSVWPHRGSPVPGILQARTLEWAAISFSNAWKQKVKVKLFSCVRLLATPWTAAHQALSIACSRQECWSFISVQFTDFIKCMGLCSHHHNVILEHFHHPDFISCIYPEFWKVKVQVAQLCPTLCDPMVFTVHGILQARILEWVAFPFSRDFPNPGIEPRSPTLQADSLLVEPQGKPLKGLGDSFQSRWSSPSVMRHFLV